MARIRPALKVSSIGLVVTVIAICSTPSESAVARSTKQANAKPLRLVARVKDFNAGYLAFSPHGKLLANGTGGKIEIWDTHRWKRLRTLCHARLSSPFAFSPNSSTITVCVTNNQVQVWDVKRARAMKTLSGLRVNVAFSPDGRLMAGRSMSKGEAEGDTKIWDAQTGRRLRVLDDTGGQYAFSSQNKTLIMASRDNPVTIYDLRTGKLISDERNAGSVTPPVVLSPDHKTFATVDAAEHSPYDTVPDDMGARPATDGGVPWPYSAMLWSARTGKLIRSFGQWESHHQPTSPIGFTPDGKRVFFNVGEKKGYSGSNAYAICFDVATGKELQAFSIENPVLMSPDRKLLITGEKELRVWAIS